MVSMRSDSHLRWWCAVCGSAVRGTALGQSSRRAGKPLDLHVIVIAVLVAAAAFLSTRARGLRDPMWVAVLAVVATTVAFASWTAGSH